MKDKSTAHLRIYVGGLTDNATMELLYDHFIQYGPIDGIVINRNFGFVQFANESSAQEAISKANGSKFQGKSISVKTAQRQNTDLVVVQHEKPPALPLTDNVPYSNDDNVDEPYDNYGNYIGDRYEKYEENTGGFSDGRDGHGGGRGMARGRGRGGRGRGAPPGLPPFKDRNPPPIRGGEWADRGPYDPYPHKMPEYPRALPVPERNDCEIIVVSKSLTEYAEYIEGRLKHLGIVVDLLFPMEDVPIGKVLGNIASRGCLYAILVMPQNQEHRSLTLTILHGLPQEHRNMPLEDALQLVSRNFQEVQRGGSSGREAVYALLGQLADGKTLTVLQYDKLIEYLQERREQQVKIELGEPLSSSAPINKTQVDLQQRIMSILHEKTAQVEAKPVQQSPAPQAPSKLFNDPTVRKALDSILQKFT